MSAELLLITGASGFIGTSILRLLKDSNVNAFAIVRNDLRIDKTGVRHLPLGDIHSIDASAYESITFVHLAGETSAKRWEDDGPSLLLTHEQLLSNLLDQAAALAQLTKVQFVNASTATVIGSSSGLVSDETQGAPETRYDAWKLRQEELVSRFGKVTGARQVSLRLPNVYGRLQDRPSAGRGFVTQQVNRALEGKPLHFFRGEPLIRDYLHVDDAVRAFIAAAHPTSPVSGSHFLGTGVGTSTERLMTLIADSVFALTNSRPEVMDVPPPLNLTKLDKRSVVISCTAFTQATRWKPRVALADGIKSMVQEAHQLRSSRV